MTVGYSNTPLARKLGIKEGFTVLFFNTPTHYKNLFSDFPKVSETSFDKEKSADFIHAFFTHLKDLEKHAEHLKHCLKFTGLIWISWPKGHSKIETDLNRDIIRAYILNHINLVDTKVAAIDEDWSGLKFVYRLEDRY